MIELADRLTTTPIPAQTIAHGMGLEAKDILPALYRLMVEGRAVRRSIGEGGLCGWRLP